MTEFRSYTADVGSLYTQWPSVYQWDLLSSNLATLMKFNGILLVLVVVILILNLIIIIIIYNSNVLVFSPVCCLLFGAGTDIEYNSVKCTIHL